MANYASLKAAIADVIKTNGSNAITGALLQQSLMSMIDSLGAGYQFAGVAAPSTNPGTPDQKVLYITSTPGTYTNFDGIIVNDMEFAILTYSGSWTKIATNIATIDALDYLVNRSKSKYYFNAFGSVQEFNYGGTTYALKFVRLINGQKYKATIKTSVPFTPNADTTLKVMAKNSDSNIFTIAQLNGIQVSENTFEFTWNLATGDNYRIGFYTGSSVLPSAAVDVTIEQDFIPMPNIGVIIPYYSSYINITEDSVFIPAHSRMIVAGKYKEISNDVTISRGVGDQSGVICYNIFTGTLFYSATSVYNYTNGDYILFTLGYGERICSLPITYFTYNGKKLLTDITLVAFIASTGDVKINITDTTITIPAFLRIVYGGGKVYRPTSAITIQRVASSQTDYQSEYIVFDPSNNSISTINEALISEATIGGKYILFSVSNGLSGCSLSMSEYTINGLSPFPNDNIDIISQNKHKESALINTALYKGNTVVKQDNKLTLLHLSDIHGSTTNIARILEYYNKYTEYLDFAIHTGDSVANTIADPNPFENVDGGEDILNVAGNHEAWLTTSDTDYLATEKQVYDKIFANSISHWGVVQPTDAATLGKCYYYKDVRNYRLIVLDSTHWHTGGNQHITDDASVQRAWFQTVLADAITNNKKVICALHYPPVNGIDIVRNLGGFNTFSAENAQDPVSIGDGWFAQDEIFGCVDTFINNGGMFICWIAGHTHEDFFGMVHGHLKQPFIVLGSSGSGSSSQGANIAGTNTQDNFNILTLSYLSASEILIKIVRIGNDYDIYNRSKNVLCFNTVNNTIISVN